MFLALTKLRLIGAALIVATIISTVFYVRYLRADNLRLKTSLEQSQVNMAALKQKNKLEQVITRKAQVIHDEINTTPQDQDGDVAPVLRDTLHWLHQPRSE